MSDIDIVSIAGAAKNLVSPKLPSDREFVLRQIEISKGLHGISQVILMNHTDCGAYGGRKAFRSDNAEKTQLINDMKQAAELIRAAYPNLEIRTVLAKISASGEVAFEDII